MTSVGLTVGTFSMGAEEGLRVGLCVDDLRFPAFGVLAVGTFVVLERVGFLVGDGPGMSDNDCGASVGALVTSISPGVGLSVVHIQEGESVGSFVRGKGITVGSFVRGEMVGEPPGRRKMRKAGQNAGHAPPRGPGP